MSASLDTVPVGSSISLFWCLFLALSFFLFPKGKTSGSGRSAPPGNSMKGNADNLNRGRKWIEFCQILRQRRARCITEKKSVSVGNPALCLHIIHHDPSFLLVSSACFGAVMCPAKITSSRTVSGVLGAWWPHWDATGLAWPPLYYLLCEINL